MYLWMSLACVFWNFKSYNSTKLELNCIDISISSLGSVRPRHWEPARSGRTVLATVQLQSTNFREINCSWCRRNRSLGLWSSLLTCPCSSPCRPCHYPLKSQFLFQKISQTLHVIAHPFSVLFYHLSAIRAWLIHPARSQKFHEHTFLSK